ncbi:unnamed protein product [Phaeothamnion confervicola]
MRPQRNILAGRRSPRPAATARAPAPMAPPQTVEPPARPTPSLPWRESIAGAKHPLSYMQFLEWALYTLGSRFELEALPVAEDMAYAENLGKPGRIVSLAFKSKEIRRLRLTYFDGGPAVQVLNAVLYPDPSVDMPVLGLDLISFGKKHLAGMDFQPLYDDAAYRERYTAPLLPVKAKYPVLGQKMSQRFYDSARFFSDAMLFARFEDADVINDTLFPAFKDYVSIYADTLAAAVAAKTEPSAAVAAVTSTTAATAATGLDADAARNLGRQAAYDQYNAERDPAHGLFVGYFGEAWSERFMDTFLFPLSQRPEGGYPKMMRPPGCG